MRLRQEQVVFLVGAAVLGLLTQRLLSTESIVKRPSRRGSEAEPVQHVVPEVSAALPDAEVTPALQRSLFSPPRDTRPLAPLPLEEPPRPALEALLPPSPLGPAPAAYGALLRHPLVVTPTAGLFEDLGDAFAAGDEAFFAPPEDGGLEGGGLELPVRARSSDDEEGADPFQDESPEERAARHEGYKQRYDWITRTTGQPLFGRIENPDRFALLVGTERASEALLFVEIDPETGVERFRSTGAFAVPIERGAIREFGFARTASNELALRVLELAGSVTRGSFDERMEFGRWCVEQRLDAAEALPTARAVFRALAAFDADDPAPRLGLARAFEAGFELDEALAEYEASVRDFPLEAVAHVGLAELEARLLLFDQAEARLRHAVSIDRGSWEARFALGRFLAARGRHVEAIPELEAANRAAPSDVDLLAVRVRIRVELGAARLSAGRLEEAAQAFASAAQADAGDQRALAGRMLTALFEDPRSATAAAEALALLEETRVEVLGFELLFARALAAFLVGDGAQAERDFRAAAEADPLRASYADAGLSFVAEATGYGDEAIDYAERAIEADPTHAYAHFQLGRLLGQRDAYEEARASLLAALESELDFEDALVALGDMAFRLGRFEDAERYLERAVLIAERTSDERSSVRALRGLNLLRLARVAEARASFQAALALADADPVAMAGLAWCTYLSGNPTEALIQLADLDEARRELPETDSWRVWARAQQVRIAEHVAKEEWFDSFNRKRLINSWLTDERSGPTVKMEDGAVVIEGAFERTGLARVYRQYPGGLFVSFEASVWVEPANVRAGLFIARERARAGETEITDEASVSRHKDGATQVRLVRSRQKPEVIDMEAPFPTGRWVRLRLERAGDGSETRITLSADGVPLVENVRMPAISAGTAPLLVGLFAEGEVGREVSVRMDDASVVYRVR